jgi:hypothetical protein
VRESGFPGGIRAGKQGSIQEDGRSG